MATLYLWIMVLSALATVVLLFLGRGAQTGPTVVAFFMALGFYAQSSPVLKVVQFSV